MGAFPTGKEGVAKEGVEKQEWNWETGEDKQAGNRETGEDRQSGKQETGINIRTGRRKAAEQRTDLDVRWFSLEAAATIGGGWSATATLAAVLCNTASNTRSHRKGGREREDC
jgi:hypothetical protein